MGNQSITVMCLSYVSGVAGAKPWKVMEKFICIFVSSCDCFDDHNSKKGDPAAQACVGYRCPTRVPNHITGQVDLVDGSVRLERIGQRHRTRVPNLVAG